jgi:hypothetical protein
VSVADDLETLLGRIAASSRRKPPLHLVGTKRFELRQKLGGGAFGEVYDARDREHGTRVALKALKSSQPEWVYRFKREFRTTADLAHPNLVRLYELFSEGDSWYLTMELIEGVAFDRFVLHAPERLTSCFVQLALGIRELHRVGCLHRDLKPSNVLVEPTGRVVLLDYGLAINKRSKHDSAVAGTPPYMAPELGMRWSPSEASDWYAFGVMLYQCLTGVMPFTGSEMEMLARKTAGAPADPTTIVADCSPELAALAMRLLSRNPHDRPGADEVLRVLGADDSEVNLGGGAAIKLAGRERELAELEAALAESRDHPVVVTLRGPPGMGKTSLVHAFADAARGRGARIYHGRCLELESVPFKGVDAAIDMLCVDLKREREVTLTDMAPGGAAALTQMFPVLKRVDAFARLRDSELSPRNPHERRQLGTRALRELLCRLSGDRPLIVFIDDLQWGDDDGVRLLLELLAPPAPSMLMIAAYRDGAAGTAPPLVQFIDGVRERGCTHRELELGVLDRAAIAELLAVTPTAQLSEDDALRESGGHPYLLSRLLEGGAQAGASGDVAVLLAGEIEQLEADARRLLEVISVAGGALPQQVAFAAAGSRPDRALLDQLRRRKLLHAQRSTSDVYVEVYHDRVREVMLATLGDDARRALHLQLATTLEQLELGDAEALARHYREARVVDRALVWTRRAAEHATRALAFARAAALYAEAVTLPIDEPTRLRLLEELATAYVQAGRREDAGATSLAAAALAERLGRVDHHAALRARAGEQLLLAGKLDEGLELIRDALVEVGVTLPSSPAVAVAESFNIGGALATRGLRFERRAEADVDPALLQRVDLELQVARALTMTDLRAPLMATRALYDALEAGEPRRVQRAAAYFAHSTSARAPRDELVVRAEALAHELAEQLGDDEAIAWADLATGYHALQCEELVESLEALERSERRFVALGPEVMREAAMARTASVIVYGNLCLDLHLARTLQAGCIDDAIARGDVFNATWARFAACMLALAADDVSLARARLREARVTWSNATDSLFAASALSMEVIIALYDDPASAWDTVVAIEPTFRSLFSSLIPLPRQMWCRLAANSALAAHVAGRADRDETRRRIEPLAAELEATHLPRAAQLVVQSHLSALAGDRERSFELQSQAAAHWASRGQGACALLALLQLERRRGGVGPPAIARELERLGVVAPERFALIFPGPLAP